MVTDKRPAESSICEIFRGPRSVGLGFAIGRTRVVTCAHVVNEVLGRDQRDPARPDGRERVQLRFGIGDTHGASRYLDAFIVGWLPVREDQFDGDDIAVLKLTEPAPAHVRLLRLVSHRAGMPVQMWGPQLAKRGGGHVRGELLGEGPDGRLQVSTDGDGPFRVRRGFSGGPAWVPNTHDVAGVLVGRGVDDGATDAYLLSTDRVNAALDGIRPGIWTGGPGLRTAAMAAGLAVVVAAITAAVVIPDSARSAPPRPRASLAHAGHPATPRPAKTSSRPRSRPRPTRSSTVIAGPTAAPALSPTPSSQAAQAPEAASPTVTSDPNVSSDDPKMINGSSTSFADVCTAWLDNDGSGNVSGVLDTYPFYSCDAELVRSGGPTVSFPATSSGEASSPVSDTGHTMQICVWEDGDQSMADCSPKFAIRNGEPVQQ